MLTGVISLPKDHENSVPILTVNDAQPNLETRYLTKYTYFYHVTYVIADLDFVNCCQIDRAPLRR